MPDLIPIADLDLSAYDLTPAFEARQTNFLLHGDYLEAMHEVTLPNLARIHLLMGKGETETAAQLVGALRAHLDDLWTHRMQAAQQGVNP